MYNYHKELQLASLTRLCCYAPSSALCWVGRWLLRWGVDTWIEHESLLSYKEQYIHLLLHLIYYLIGLVKLSSDTSPITFPWAVALRNANSWHIFLCESHCVYVYGDDNDEMMMMLMLMNMIFMMIMMTQVVMMMMIMMMVQVHSFQWLFYAYRNVFPSTDNGIWNTSNHEMFSLSE